MKPNRTVSAVAALIFVSAAACTDSSGPGTPRQIPGPPPDLSNAGSIRVEVSYAGPVPEPAEVNMRGTPACAAAHPEPVLDGSLRVSDGRIENAVVFLKSGLGDHGYSVPSEPVVVDQKGCLYHPRVAAAMLFQPIEFVNSDTEPHNVHGRPQIAKPWNFMISRQNASRTLAFDKAEVGIRIGCDIHPWMVAYLSVFAHPYFAVTPAEGTVTLERVPPGDYVVAAWHERLGATEQSVRLEPNGTARVELTYASDALK
jgi:plastocyanin